MNLDINLLRGVLTLLLLIAFIGVWAWAWSHKRQHAFSEAANLPFADDDLSQSSGIANSGIANTGTTHSGEPS